MKQLTDSTFNKEVGETGPSVVMFCAPWAGPCNLVRPAFEAAASRYGNQITFAEFDLDDNPEVPARYGVKQVPVFYFMNDGVPVRLIAGAVPEDVLIDACKELIE